ncbi:uncharacterized protein V6R79_011281 [Siganus canaliculatus]
MERINNQTSGHTGSKLAAKKKVKCSIKVREMARARVNIGSALPRWRALKASKGWRSDAAVAVNLLDAMASMPSRANSSGSSKENMKFSETQVHTLVKREVCRALNENATKLQTLMESIEQLEQEVKYGRSIQELEARVKVISQRAEAALASMATKMKSPVPAPKNVERMSDSDKLSVEAESEKDPVADNSGECIQMMKSTKEALKQMHVDKEALMAATADLSEETFRSAFTPDGSSQKKAHVVSIKKEPEDQEEKENQAEGLEESEEPKAKRVKQEDLSPEGSESPKQTEPQQSNTLYPPLPTHTPPSVLRTEAGSYNIPQRPEVRLALIRNPGRLSVLWNVSEKDPLAPPMDSYRIYMTMEKDKGSGTFSTWTTLGEVKAIPLPICVMISKYKPGYKVCVTVVGKDEFGRYGPFSEVVTAIIPE